MNEWIRKAKAENRHLFEHEALKLFEAYGIPVPACHLAVDAANAVQAAAAIGYPVVLKIVSRDVLHKSDAGGVILNIADEASLRSAYEKILMTVTEQNPDTLIEGLLVCEMLKPGLETIIGMTKDASFGPTLMFGLGGIFVEILKDVSFRIMPLTKEDALAMIREIKGYPLLQGVRGEKPKDIDALAALILNVARMVGDNPEIKELDINPCFVYEQGAIPVDARVML